MSIDRLLLQIKGSLPRDLHPLVWVYLAPIFPYHDSTKKRVCIVHFDELEPWFVDHAVRVYAMEMDSLPGRVIYWRSDTPGRLFISCKVRDSAGLTLLGVCRHSTALAK